MPTATEQAQQDYYSTSEAARYLGVSTRTVHRYEEQGRITAHRLPSGHRRYLRADLDSLLTRVAS